ncbi:MAG: RNA polymerase sigma factor [Thermodesulfobacteriota bacterium]
MDVTLEQLVEDAKDGDNEALEEIVRRVQDRVYGLAIRMLSHPADAEDATQEILVKVITHLGSFRGESAFSTWVYRVASNHLLTTHKRRAERREITFEAAESHVGAALSADWADSMPNAERGLIAQEIMLRCIQGLLLCLDRDLRIAYILAAIFDTTSKQGAYILGITPAAFRKRLSRAKGLLRDFMQKNCGLVNANNPCQCNKLADFAVETRWVNPEKLTFVSLPRRSPEIGVRPELLQGMDELERVAALFKSHPEYAAPDRLVDMCKSWLRRQCGHSVAG